MGKACEKNIKEYEQLLAQEELILDVSEAFHKVLKGVDIAKLSKRLGVNEYFLRDVMNGYANPSLHQISDIALALGYEPHFTLKPKYKGNNHESDSDKFAHCAA